MEALVQGIGIVGGFGTGIKTFSQALTSGFSKTQSVTVKTPEGLREMPAYLADTSGLEAFVHKKTLRRMDHYSRMALLGAYLALEDAGTLDIDRSRLGIVMASGYGASRSTCAFLDSFIEGNDAFSSPTHFSNSVHNVAAAHISITLGVTGPCLTVSQFEMSVTSALISAVEWLKEERVEKVLLGAVDEYCDVLGYCWHRYFGDRATAPHVMDPINFDLQSAVPGEGAVFFLLTAAKVGAISPYGVIEDMQMGRCGKGRIDVPDGSRLFIGPDGHKQSGSYYKEHLPENARINCYTPLYGSLPTGQAFDIAIAALSRKNMVVFPSPHCSEVGGRAGAIDDRQALGDEPIHCIKISSSGELGSVVLC
jgi:3-oxoacyl-[acyl-carrier-protein] synthase II